MQGNNKGFLYVSQKNSKRGDCALQNSQKSSYLQIFANSVTSQVIQGVNSIKSRPQPRRPFSKLCKEVDSEQGCLLHHTEARWLLKEKVLLKRMW